MPRYTIKVREVTTHLIEVDAPSADAIELAERLDESFQTGLGDLCGTGRHLTEVEEQDIVTIALSDSTGPADLTVGTPEQGDTGDTGVQGDTAEQGDTTTPLQQLVETGYFLGSGDRQHKDGLVAPEDLYTKEDLEAGIGDGLLPFLLSELVFENGETPDYTLEDRVAQALYRLSVIQAQLDGVYKTLLYSDRWLKKPH